MSLIRRKTLPKLIRTSEIAARWHKSGKQIKRILRDHQCREVQTASGKTSPVMWVESDVRRVEQKIFGGIL